MIRSALVNVRHSGTFGTRERLAFMNVRHAGVLGMRERSVLRDVRYWISIDIYGCSAWQSHSALHTFRYHFVRLKCLVWHSGCSASHRSTFRLFDITSFGTNVSFDIQVLRHHFIRHKCLVRHSGYSASHRSAFMPCSAFCHSASLGRHTEITLFGLRCQAARPTMEVQPTFVYK